VAFNCSVTITSVIGVPAGSSGTTTGSILVAGTQTGLCEPTASGVIAVLVEVSCGTNSAKAIARVVNGKWSTDVPLSCTCNGDIEVTASCALDPECKATFARTLQCETANTCPTGTIDVSVGDCNSDGTRNVTLIAEITSIPSGTSVGQFNYGNNNYGQLIPISAPGSYPDPTPHAFTPPGPYPVEFDWGLPANCPPLIATVPELSTCPIVCPAGSVVITADPPGDCDADGKRTVTFNVSMSGVTAQHYQWDFGDGVTQPSMTGQPPATQTYEFPAPSSGSTMYTVILTITTENGACTYPATVTVDISECAGSPKPPTPSSGSSWCGAFVYVVAALLGLTLAFAIIILALNCHGDPVSNTLWYLVIGFGSAAVAAIIAWYVLCAVSVCPCAKKCDWLVITWIAILVGGIVAYYLSGCCPWMKYVAYGLLAVALLVCLYWWAHCKPSSCDIYAKLLVALVSGAAPALVYLHYVPAFAMCGNGTVSGVVAAIGAALGLLVAKCKSQA
jgi:hypothetical protein